MLDAITTFLERSVEWQEYQQHGLWSWNIIMAMGILALTVSELYAVGKQGYTVWKLRSGKCVSVYLFSFNTWAFYSCGIYSYYINGAVAAFNALLTGSAHLVVMVLLCRFKKLTSMEIRCMQLFPLMVPLIVLTEGYWSGMLQSAVFVGITLMIGWMMGTQPLEMWREQKTGAVDIGMYIVYVPTTVVWLGYAMTLGDPAFIVGNIIAMLVVGATIAVWCHIRVREPHPPQILVAMKPFF